MQIFRFWLSALVLTAAAHGADFTKTITTEERAAAGLDKLSPAELEELKAIVERYKSGEVAVVKKEAEQKVAVAEAKVKEVEAKVATAEPLSTKKQPSWVSALLTLQKASEKPGEVEVFKDRLNGTLKSFEGKRRFNLQSGQVWEMVQADYYSGPALDAPAVTVKPGVLGAYWLVVEEARLRVKVKLIRIE